MPKKDVARLLAAKILADLEKHDSYAEAAIDGAFKKRPQVDSRDRALTTQLVYGVLRWRLLLDLHIEKAAARPIGKLNPKLLEVLRIGAYQLLYLDRMPKAIAVSATVELADSFGLDRARGLINAVLRRISEGVTEPDVPEDPAQRLSQAHSIPLWLAQRWLREEGEEGAAMLAREASRIPPLYLRLDTRTMDRAAALECMKDARESGLGAFAPEAVWAVGVGDPRKLEPVSAHKAVVQGQASQLIAPLLGPKPGMRVLDACSGPGLKTSQLARLMDGKGEIVALEIHPHRARQVEALARDLGYDCVTTAVGDASSYRADSPFDAVLVDAPCSGLGVLAHAPERKWHVTPEDPARMALLQRQILEGAADNVKSGGVLVYATCTTAREENETLVESFLRDHPEFSLDNAGDFLELPPGFISSEGYLRTYPHDPGDDQGRVMDAFFAARMKRR